MVAPPHRARQSLLLLGMLLLWLVFNTAASRLEKIQVPSISAEMQIALPLFMQVVMSGGDRFLAANIATLRALTTDTQNQRPDRFLVQAIVQKDIAWLNPRHEDNYYLAAANLSWNGQLDSAQHILQKASEARPFDMLPPFFFAFNEYHFKHDPVTAAHWLKVAAEHSQDNEEQRLILEKIAARWTEKGQDRHEAVNLLEGMAAKSRHRALRHLISLRAKRVRHLIRLDEAIATYKKQYRRLPPSLETLTQSNVIDSIPQDPFGHGYTIDAQGIAQINTPKNK